MRTIATVAVVSLAVASHAGPLKAQTLERVTLGEALERSARDGLPLRIARSEAEITAARARQDAAWPNPSATAVHEDLDGAGAGYSETLYDLAQPIVWPWRHAARGDVADAVAREAAARFRADSAAAALEVVRAWLDAWRGARDLEVLETATGVFREADRAATARNEDGDLSGFDLRRLRVERSRYEADLAGARIGLRAARRRLATLIAPEAPAGEIGAAGDPGEAPPAPPVEAALARARAVRAEIAAADAAGAAARAGLAATRGERIPEPTLRLGWKEQSDGLEGPALGLSIPLPLFDRRGAAVEAARAGFEAASARAGLVRRRVEDEVRIAVERHAALRERAELVRDRLLVDADDLLEIARVSWDAGEISLVELLDAAGAWREALTTRAAIEADLVESEHELRRAIGGPIGPSDEEGS